MTGARTRPLLLPLLVAAALTAAGAAPASAARACAPVRDPYAGTRYAGVDLTRIRATGVGCSTARTVARRAHRRGLGLTPPPSGVRRYTWNGWRVTGDLRPELDRYTARKGSRVVTWRF
jgi:hypothetical protein